MKINEILTEAVGQDLIYHSPGSGSIARQIMKSKKIKMSEPYWADNLDDDRDSISATRNQFLRFGAPPYGSPVQFVLNRSALRQSGWQVKPVRSGGTFTDNPGSVGHKEETEERIWHPRNLPIPLKAPWVVGIEVDPSRPAPADFLALANKLKLPVLNMRSYKPLPPKPQPQYQSDAVKKYVAKNFKIDVQDDWGANAVPGRKLYSLYYHRPRGEIEGFHSLYEVPSLAMVQTAKNLIIQRSKKGLPIDDIVDVQSIPDFEGGDESLRITDPRFRLPADWPTAKK